jgi:hypothetical protein
VPGKVLIGTGDAPTMFPRKDGDQIIRHPQVDPLKYIIRKLPVTIQFPKNLVNLTKPE